MTGGLEGLNLRGTLAAARGYAARGWPVVPIAGMAGTKCGCRDGADCSHPAKHPLCKGGLTSASTDRAVIASWWRRWPWAGVGIVTGVRSGLVVIDVDPDHGGDRSIATLAGRGLHLPPTLAARTGGGGRHLLYGHPGRPVPNTTSRIPGAGPLPGVDVRGDGGYIVAAPTLHRSGHRYRWDTGSSEPATWPEWAVQPPAAIHATPTVGVGRIAGYVKAALDGETARVTRSEDGTRNDTLNRAAFALGTLIGAGALDRDTATRALTAAASSAGIPEREADRTIRSGLDGGQHHPRQLPNAATPWAPSRSPTALVADSFPLPPIADPAASAALSSPINAGRVPARSLDRGSPGFG